MADRDERIQAHLSQAYTRAIHPDAIQHIHAALRELDPECPPGLLVCDGCHRTMLPERYGTHDC